MPTGKPHVQGCQHFLLLQRSAQRSIKQEELACWPASFVPSPASWLRASIQATALSALSGNVFLFVLLQSCFFPYPLSKHRLGETYLNSKILTEFPEGNIRLTKLKSPTYTLPSGPEAKATGAKSLLLWAGPLQLVQATLRWCPLPIMVDMTGGCWEMNIFSPFPLCMIPRSKKKKTEYKKKQLPHNILSNIWISLIVQSSMELWPGIKKLGSEAHCL